MEPVKETDIKLFTWVDLRSKQGLATLFEAFEADAPTHWDEGEPIRRPWDRAACVKSVLTRQLGPDFARRGKQGYTAHVGDTVRGLSYISIYWGALEGDDLARPYHLADRLVAALAPEYATVHPTFAGQPQWNRAGCLRPQDLMHYGLNGVCARNYFGPTLAAELDGRTQIDVLPEPWRHDVAALTASHRRLNLQVKRKHGGLFADYKTMGRYKPGKTWSPLARPG